MTVYHVNSSGPPEHHFPEHSQSKEDTEEEPICKERGSLHPSTLPGTLQDCHSHTSPQQGDAPTPPTVLPAPLSTAPAAPLQDLSHPPGKIRFLG